MPKSPIWEYAIGQLSVEEYYSNARATHYEILVGACGYRLTIYPHEIPDLRRLVDELEAHQNRPRLVLDERRHA